MPGARRGVACEQLSRTGPLPAGAPQTLKSARDRAVRLLPLYGQVRWRVMTRVQSRSNVADTGVNSPRAWPWVAVPVAGREDDDSRLTRRTKHGGVVRRKAKGSAGL
eukprot:scaffold58933_cov75-Phaeocystis_antarctica.AAC.1